MSYLSFKIVSVIVLLIILVIVLLSKRRVEQQPAMANATKIKNDTFTTVEFYNDSKSKDIEKRRKGSSFRMYSDFNRGFLRVSLEICNWGDPVDYIVREDGFVEIRHSVEADCIPKLMALCNNAQDGGEVLMFLYNKFAKYDHAASQEILKWFKENQIKVTSWNNW